MSLILDALRKMEQERRSRRGVGDLRSEVLRYRGAVTSQQAKPYLLVTLGAALLLGGVGAGYFLKGERGPALPQPSDNDRGALATKAESTAPPATVEFAPTAPTPPAAPTPPSASPTAAADAAAARVVASDAALAGHSYPASEPKPKADGAAAAARSGAKRARKAPAADDAIPNVGEGKRTPTRRQMADDSLGAIPDITVSGIAWQEERNLRRAVLNGTLVGEGAEVAGARVIEIKENRVRLSRGGHVFDVVFSSGLSSR